MSSAMDRLLFQLLPMYDEWKGRQHAANFKPLVEHLAKKEDEDVPTDT